MIAFVSGIAEIEMYLAYATSKINSRAAMRVEERLILELCRSKRNSARILSLACTTDLDWKHFIRVVQKHEVAALALSRILEYRVPPEVEKQLAPIAREEVAKALHDRKTVLAELKKINKSLRDEGVDSILLKGLSLDFHELRTIGDLDLLVRKEQLIDSIEALSTIGYCYIGNDRNPHLNSCEKEMLMRIIENPSSRRREKNAMDALLSWNNHYELYNRNLNLLLELHTNLFQKERAYDENLNSIWAAIDLFWSKKKYDKNVGCYTLSSEHSLLLMCLHTAINRSPAKNTFKLRLAVDIDKLISNGIRWSELLLACGNLRAAPFVLFALLLTRKLFDAPIPEQCLLHLEKECTKWQLISIGLHLSCLKSLSAYRIMQCKVTRILIPFAHGGIAKDRIKWLFLLPIIFPSKKSMAAIFNLRENSLLVYFTYLLNPLRWIYLLVRNLARK